MRASTNHIQKEESKTIKRKFYNKSARNALALLLSAALLCCNVGGSLALAADLSDSSVSSSVSAVEPEPDGSAESSATPVVVAPEDSSADGSTEAPQPGKDDEVAASKDDDVGADASAVITGVMSAPRRQITLLAATEAEPDDESGDDAEEADPDIDPTADDGSGEGGQAEDVAETEHENQTSEADGNNDAVPTTSISSGIAGVEMSYAADATTSFKASSLKPGQVWVDKSVSKTDTTETSFSETLSIYGTKYTTESEYSTGNYVLVLDTTRSLYNADHSGKLVKAVTKATNDIVVEICKNPLSNVAVVGFSADNRERDKNKNADATTVILGMGNWKKAGKSLLTCDTSDDNECKWYIGATDAAKSSKVASTGKRYISYGTFTQAGVAHAASILKAQKDKADTAGYMLILTDGVPTYGTTKWAANYDVKNAAWQSKTSASIGNGGGADPKAGAYCLMTMQYWNKVLKSQYAEFKMLTAHFSNDGYDSSEEALAKWCVGVVNNVTYSAGTGSSTNDAGYVGSVISSGWPKNRLSSTYTGSSKADLKSAAKKLKTLMTDANVTKLGLSKSTDFPAPARAQFANLSNQSSADNKAKALEHVFDNLQNMVHKDKITQGALKAGTSVTFTTKTGNYMTVSGDPVLYYNNKAYNGTKSGNSYTYSVGGVTALVQVSTSGNRSTVTATIPADLVNKNAMDGNPAPIQVKFDVDLFSNDYQTVFDASGGDFTTYTNEYSSEQSKVTFTTSKDNPYYATTGTDTSSKKANTTDTLSYVSQITKAKSGKKSTALLGNNGKLDMVSNRSEIEVSVWEINQANQTKVLPGVTWYVADTSGRKINLNGTELSFTSSTNPQVIEGLPAGQYRLVTSNVPAGYVLPDYVPITVQKQAERQHYDIYVPTIMIDIIAIDAITEEPLPGITATVYDKAGKPVYQNVTLEFIREYVPAGDYTVKINHVPDRYAYPADTPIKVKAIRDVQKFVIPIEHLGSITVTKYDSDGKTPLKGVTFALSDSSGKTIMTKTTDAKGQVVFIADDKLVAGDYVVTETKTVPGHTLLTEPIRCTIPMVMTDAEAQAQNADTSKGFHSPTTKSWYFFDLTFDVTNHANFFVPMTGGTQTALFVSGFAALAAMAGAVYYLQHRKKVS